MGDVVAMDDMRLHVVVHARDAAHIMSVSLLEGVVKGAEPSHIPTEPVTQQIIEEWLELAT